MATDKEPTFLLQPWSVQRRNGGWYVAKPTSRFDKSRTEWRGPYPQRRQRDAHDRPRDGKAIERRD